MTGLSYPEYPFAELFAPILPELDALYWDAEFQSTPYRWEWLFENREWLEAIEIKVESSYPEVPALLWRPGALSILAPHLVFDEWSYLTGFSATEDGMKSIIRETSRSNFVREDHLMLIKKLQGIRIVQVDGWWEVYTPRQEWLERLNAHRPGRWVSSDNYGCNYPARD